MNQVVLFVMFSNILLVLCDEAPDQDFQTHLERLHEKLLNEDVYDKTLRPVPVSKQTTASSLEVSFSHEHIVSVELEKGWLTVVGPVLLVWTDSALSWNASDYGNLTSMEISADEIWTPELVVLNANPEDFHIHPTEVFVRSQGDVFQVPYSRMRVPCAMNMADYPKDEHVCKVRFASLVDTDDEQEYDTLEDLAENALTPTNPWQVQEWQVTVFPEWESGHVLNRTYLELTIWLKRRSSHYLFSVTLPWVSSVVTMLLVFWLPADSRLRLTLCCINMLLVALMLQRMVPLLEGSYRPAKLVSFLEGAMLMQALIAIIAVAFLNLTSGNVLFPIAVPTPVVQFLTGAAVAALCLCDHASTRPAGGAPFTVPSDSGDTSQQQEQRNTSAVTRLSQERAKEWMLVSDALDRVFFVVFLVAAICVAPL
ncbi:acetylcholine receptor subunit delta-like [Amblyomma americanum]